jgi:hypothetical protein
MRLLVLASFAMVLVSSVAVAQPTMSWKNRESWLIAEQDEEQKLVDEIALELGISAALVMWLPELELGWLANCADAAHSAHGAATVEAKINRFLKLKQDIPYQWNILTQQLHNNPTEWHRFQQSQEPYLEWKERLTRQGSHMKQPTSCQRKTPPPRNAGVPPNCAGLLAQEKTLSQAMIWQYSVETRAPIQQQLNQVEQQILQYHCHNIVVAPPRPPSGYGCGITVRC